MRSGPLVVIVDDDESMRESLPDLVREFGYAAQAFPSAEEFLASGAVANAKCLILDIGLPGMSGPELQRELVQRGYAIPTILITGRADYSRFQQGVVACLLKPFRDGDLQAALVSAFRGRN